MFKCCWWLVLGWCCSTRLHSTLHRKQSQSGALEYFMALYLKYCYAAWCWCVDQSNISQFVRGPGTSSPEPSLVLGSSLVSHDGRLIATLGSFDVMLRPRLGFQCEGFILRFWLGRWWQGGLICTTSAGEQSVYLQNFADYFTNGVIISGTGVEKNLQYQEQKWNCASLQDLRPV